MVFDLAASKVRVDHPADQLLEAQRRPPPQPGAGAARVADRRGRLRRAGQPGIDPNLVRGGESNVPEGDLGELSDRVADGAREHIVDRLIGLKRPPGTAPDVSRERPVADHPEVARTTWPARPSLIEAAACVIFRETNCSGRRSACRS